MAISPDIQETTFLSTDQFTIYEQTWGCPEPKGLVIITHGIAEHIGRYAHVAEALAASGYQVIGWDLRGHGKSSGKRNYVHRFTEFLDDLGEVLHRAQTKYPDLPIFLMGHSLGGGIVTYFAIDRKPAVAGLVLSGASVKVSDDISPFLQKISGVLSVLAPRLPAIKLDSSFISKDPAVVADYDSDPLNYRGGILARTGSELLKATKIITARMAELELPVLIMHGSVDKLADVSGSEMLHARISSKDKTLKIYEGLYHEILNEPEKDGVIKDILTWLDGHKG